MALAEISKDKEEADDGEEVKAPVVKGKKAIFGTSTMLKLPFVIGTPEYTKHPYAGIIYLGNLGADIEQPELYKEE